ncbi:MAG: YheV family putative metal-binding protein [Pseudomonadales bacterium]|nr:YheV family putative metal-binding protein [Pseudomonadales bacterium]
MSSRRFIAGAVCPRCRAEDRIVTRVQGGELVQWCISGSYEREAQPGSSVPHGRLENRDPGAVEQARVRLVTAEGDPSREPPAR